MEGFVMKQAPQAVPKQKAPLLSFLWVTFQGSCLAGLLQASPPECGTPVGKQAVLNRQGPFPPLLLQHVCSANLKCLPTLGIRYGMKGPN